MTTEQKIVRETQITSSKQSYTLSKILSLKDKFNFDLAIQRNTVWTDIQKSNLIHSILYGFPIPDVYAVEDEKGILWFLDGKQRFTTILSYLQGELQLSKNTPSIYGHELANTKFMDLPQNLRDLFLSESIDIKILKNITEEEIDLMFVRMNSGSVLNKIELIRAGHSKLIPEIESVSETEFFTNYAKLSKSAINRFVNQELVLQIAYWFSEGNSKLFKGFNSKDIEGYVQRLKSSDSVFETALVQEMQKISKYLTLAVSDFDKDEITLSLKKVHIPMIFHIARKGMEDKLTPQQFALFLRYFFVMNSENFGDYFESTMSGSSKKENVMTRFTQIEEGYKLFKKDVVKIGQQFDKLMEQKAKERKEIEDKKAEVNSAKNTVGKVKTVTKEETKPNATDKKEEPKKVEDKKEEPKATQGTPTVPPVPTNKKVDDKTKPQEPNKQQQQTVKK